MRGSLLVLSLFSSLTQGAGSGGYMGRGWLADVSIPSSGDGRVAARTAERDCRSWNSISPSNRAYEKNRSTMPIRLRHCAPATTLDLGGRYKLRPGIIALFMAGRRPQISKSVLTGSFGFTSTTTASSRILSDDSTLRSGPSTRIHICARRASSVFR